MIADIWYKILFFCDEKSKYRFGLCSGECLDIIYNSIVWNVEELKKCIQRNNMTLFKKFLIYYGPLTARAK